MWEKLSTKLQEWGFATNEYDDCIGNKMIEGKQYTVTWHVDDLKVSHTSQEVVDTIIQLLSNEFGKESKLEISHGKVCNYLGMILDFTQPGELKLHMFDYINMIISEMPKYMVGTSTIPASQHLFDVNDTDLVKL